MYIYIYYIYFCYQLHNQTEMALEAISDMMDVITVSMSISVTSDNFALFWQTSITIWSNFDGDHLWFERIRRQK